MKSIKLTSHVGTDGMLEIELPDCQDQEVEVLVVYHPVQRPTGWSQAFLSTAGSWHGQPLFRESQPLPAERESLL